MICPKCGNRHEEIVCKNCGMDITKEVLYVIGQEREIKHQLSAVNNVIRSANRREQSELTEKTAKLPEEVSLDSDDQIKRENLTKEKNKDAGKKDKKREIKTIPPLFLTMAFMSVFCFLLIIVSSFNNTIVTYIDSYKLLSNLYFICMIVAVVAFPIIASLKSIVAIISSKKKSIYVLTIITGLCHFACLVLLFRSHWNYGSFFLPVLCLIMLCLRVQNEQNERNVYYKGKFILYISAVLAVVVLLCFLRQQCVTKGVSLRQLLQVEIEYQDATDNSSASTESSIDSYIENDLPKPYYFSAELDRIKNIEIKEQYPDAMDQVWPYYGTDCYETVAANENKENICRTVYDIFIFRMEHDPSLSAASMAYMDRVMGTRYLGEFSYTINDEDEWADVIYKASERFADDQDKWDSTLKPFKEMLKRSEKTIAIETRDYNSYAMYGGEPPNIVEMGMTDYNTHHMLKLVYTIKGKKVALLFDIEYGFMPVISFTNEAS